MTNKSGNIPDKEWKKLHESAWNAIMAADYKKAMAVLAPAYKKYPEEFKVVKLYAATLGDYAESQPEGKRETLKKQGCKILAGLLRRLRHVDRELRFSTRNEYYYHSGQFNKQYYLGEESVRDGSKWGHYTQGVGSANYVYAHAQKGHGRLVEFWAKRAVCAWENFFKIKADYYNAYVHYALALGLLGRVKDMEAALNKSAKLSGKPQSYHEFKDVREKILSLKYSKKAEAQK